LQISSKYFVFFSILFIILPSQIFSNVDEIYNNFLLYSRNQPDSLLSYVKKISVTENLNQDKEIKAVINMFLGRYYDVTGNLEEGAKWLLESKNYFENFQKKKYLPLVYIYLGNLYRHFSDFQKSNSNYQLALNQKGSITPNQIAWVYNHFGDNHKANNRMDSAMYYYGKSLEKSIEIKDTSIQSNNYNNIGDVFVEISLIDSAISYYKKSLELNYKINDRVEVIQNLRLLSYSYLLKNDLKSSLEYFYKTLDFLGNYKNYYELRKTLEQGIKIFKHLHNIDSVAKYSELLYKMEREFSKNQQDNNRKLIEFESDSKNLEMKYKLLQEVELNQSYYILLLISFAALILLILGFLWLKFHNKKKENIKLQQAYDKINELNETKDKFFSIIAHDLKGPVSTMKNMLHLMVSDYQNFSDEDLYEMLEEFKTQTDSTLGLLLNLLDWSRSQRGSIEYHHNKVNLNYLIDDNIFLLAGIAKTKEIELINELNKDLYVYIDENTINTVIRNLISNSIKYSTEKSKIEIGAIPKDEDHISVYIRDYGVGMTIEQVNNLFKLKSNKSTYGTNNEKGTGLGLIICKDFVQNNFGEIWIESHINKGSTFYFSLRIFK
jgi:signal transduction histidine kinase